MPVTATIDDLAGRSEDVALLQCVFDALDHPAAVLDATGALRFANAAWRRTAANETEDSDLCVRVGEDYVEACSRYEPLSTRLAPAGVRAVLTGLSARFACEYTRVHGTERRRCELCVTPLSAGGRGVLVAHREIAAASQRDDVRLLLASIVESAEDAIISKTLDGVITSWNAAAEKMLGYTAAEAIGRNILMVVPDDRVHEEREIISRLRKGERVRHLETLRRKKDGTLVPVQLSASPVRNSAGEIVGGAKIMHDVSKRKEVEDALRRREEQLRTLGDNIPEGAIYQVVVGKDGSRKTTYVSGGIERLLGVPRWEAEADPNVGHQLIHPEDRERVRLAEEACFASRRPFDCEFRSYTRSGELKWLHARSAPRRQPDGRVFWDGIVVDATQRKTAEVERLAALEAATRAIQEQQAIVGTMAEGLVIADGQLNLIYWNAAALRIHGYDSLDEVRRGLHTFAATFELRRPGGPALPIEEWPMARLGRGEPVVDDEMHIVRLDRGLHWTILYNGTTIRGADGGIERMVMTLHDVTERRRALDAIRESELRFRTLAETTPAFIWVSGEDGKFNYVNRSWQEFCGRDSQSDLNAEWIDGIHPDDRPKCLEAYALAFSRGLSFETEYRYRAKDGTYCWLLDRAGPRRSEEGQLLGYVGTRVDITDQKSVHEQIRRMAQDLERQVQVRTAALEAANRELEAFSYSVSHDLRSPLRAIDGFSRILLSDYASGLPDEAKEYLTDVRANAQRMGQLVDDLLALSRLSRQTLRREQVDAWRMAEACSREVRSDRDSATNVEVTIESMPDCIADASLLRQVWLNLIANAVKFSAKKPSPEVKVGGEKKDGVPTYFVRDNGAGFDMRYVHKLFGVFQRLHRMEEFSGTGVGLANVQRIVHRHGGRVWAEAVPNEGATFWFTIPDEGTRDG